MRPHSGRTTSKDPRVTRLNVVHGRRTRGSSFRSRRDSYRVTRGSFDCARFARSAQEARFPPMTTVAPTTPSAWRLRDRVVPVDRPVVVGIVNVTPDSFSDGGRHFGAD